MPSSNIDWQILLGEAEGVEADLDLPDVPRWEGDHQIENCKWIYNTLHNRIVSNYFCFLLTRPDQYRKIVTFKHALRSLTGTLIFFIHASACSAWVTTFLTIHIMLYYQFPFSKCPSKLRWCHNNFFAGRVSNWKILFHSFLCFFSTPGNKSWVSKMWVNRTINYLSINLY